MSFIPLTTLPRFSSITQAPHVKYSFGKTHSLGRDKPGPSTCFRSKTVRPGNGIATDAQKTSRFFLRDATQFADVSPVPWAVKGILRERGLGLVYGAPGAGKSFLLLDIACAVAEGLPWFGRKTRRAPVVYLCLEGAGGFAQRVLAWERANGKKAPELLKVVTEDFHLHSAEDTAQLSRSVLSWVKSLPVDLGKPVVIVDTLNRAMPGSDENGSADMGLSLQGCAELQKACGGLVLLVHHSGKDATKGPRGHSSLLGALDTSIVLWRSAKGRHWKSEKVKDGKDDILGAFELIQVPLGQDDDGDEVTSCVVQAQTPCPAETDISGVSDSLKLALTTLEDAADDVGLSVDAQVSLASWRAFFYEACPAPSDSGKRNAFARARKELQEEGFTIESGQAISITVQGLAQINSLTDSDSDS